MVVCEVAQEEESVAQGEPVTKLTDYFMLTVTDESSHNVPNLPKDFTWNQWNQREKKWQSHRGGGHMDEDYLFVGEALG